MEAVIPEVQDQVSGLLQVVVVPQVLYQEVAHVAVDQAEVRQEAVEETKYIEGGLANPDYHKK